MRVLKNAIRIISGLVFIFSGTVKAIDPLGSAYKFQDYFQAFHVGFAKFLGLPLAIILVTAEFTAGFSVLTGFRQKAGIWAILIMMLLFTPLTLILALTNPVSDCGCFGDAVHLTNWQTFGKNIILLLFVLILFRERRLIKNVCSPVNEWLLLAGSVVFIILFSVYNLKYLPVMDFLPYKAGVNIPEKMALPEGMPVDEYETTFIYEKDGAKKEFSLDNYPAGDSTWKFIDQKSVLVKKGYSPPIHDFIITTPQNEDITSKVLADKGYSLLMIAKKLEEAGEEDLRNGFDVGRYCRDNGTGFYILTASVTDNIKKYAEDLPFCFADETTLKTIVRSNPGYLLIRDGTIVAKWSQSNLPGKEWFADDMTGKRIILLNDRLGRIVLAALALALCSVLLTLRILLKDKT